MKRDELTQCERKVLDNTVNQSWGTIALVRGEYSREETVKTMRRLIRWGLVKVIMAPHWRYGKARIYRGTEAGTALSCWAG